jgi:hypothetical protein
MKLSELSLTDLNALYKYNKKLMKEFDMLGDYDKQTNDVYLLLDSKLIAIENAIEAFEEKIIY